MTGQTMEPDEDMDNVRYERETVTGGDASDPLDLSTGGSKADSLSSSRPVSDIHSRQEMFLPAPRQHLDIPHTTTAVTSGYTLSRSHTDIPMSRPWPFSPGSPSSIVRPFPHSGDRSPPKDLARFPQPSANRTFQPERNGAPMFPGSAMDSNIEDHRDLNDIEVVSNGVENLGPLSGRPLPAAYPDGALMYNPLGPSGMLSLSLPSPYDTAHMSPLSMTAASVLNRKRRQERVDKKDKEATTSKSSPSAATVTSAQASSNSPDLSDESEPKKTKTVPDEKKDEAYWERRRKNNEAAKRSRDARRQKEEEIAVRAAWLEQENLKLRAEIAVLKNETAKLHCLLLNRRV